MAMKETASENCHSAKRVKETIEKLVIPRCM